VLTPRRVSATCSLLACITIPSTLSRIWSTACCGDSAVSGTISFTPQHAAMAASVPALDISKQRAKGPLAKCHALTGGHLLNLLARVIRHTDSNDVRSRGIFKLHSLPPKGDSFSLGYEYTFFAIM